jgi:hypothetical protein
MLKAFRTGLSRRFTAITVSSRQAEEFLKLKSMGDEDIYLYRKDAEANQRTSQQLKADTHVEDLAEGHRLALLDLISKHHVHYLE